MADVYLDGAAWGYQQRARRLMLAVVLVFAGLLLRLAHLQLVEGDSLKAASERNFVRDVVLPADRGTIYDRHGRVLAVNRPSFDLYVTPAQVRDLDALVAGVREVLELDELEAIHLRERIEEPRGMWRYQPIRVERDIDRALVSRVEALRARADGLSVQVEFKREYPYGELGAHLLGYLGRPRAEELKDTERRYTKDSMVGRFGLEKRYEQILAGHTGLERYVVDVRGARQDGGWARHAMEQDNRIIPPERGHDLWLTIDIEVQRLLVEALARHESGAAVVLDPNDGTVLGLVSKPGFDPNEWSSGLSSEVWQQIQENPFNPMLDKSVHAYFPGSVYKVVTAMAGLEEGVLDADEEIDSPGRYEYGNHVFHCHKRGGHGKVNLFEAMAASADVYFYKLGERMGIDTLAVYGERFGFGTRTGLGINGESAGVVPTRAHHEAHGGYQAGLALSTAIGQGDVRTTPVQMALAYGALANGGTVWTPRVVESIRRPDGQVVSTFEPVAQRTLGVDSDHIALVDKALERAVNDDKLATGHLAALPYGTVAGKTGTAQVRRIQRDSMRQSVKRFRDRDHAWFAAFAPYESPRLVVVVFLEHGGSGGKDAAPIARQILEAYHQRIEPIFQTTAAVDRDRLPERGAGRGGRASRQR
ncbi:MAG: penicillin-binding protein 2 [bacterium]